VRERERGEGRRGKRGKGRRRTGIHSVEGGRREREEGDGGGTGDRRKEREEGGGIRERREEGRGVPALSKKGISFQGTPSFLYSCCSALNMCCANCSYLKKINLHEKRNI
jgi:hypothetical protein